MLRFPKCFAHAMQAKRGTNSETRAIYVDCNASDAQIVWAIVSDDAAAACRMFRPDRPMLRITVCITYAMQTMLILVAFGDLFGRLAQF